MGTHYSPTGSNYGDEPDELNEHLVDPGDPDGVVAAERQRRLDQNRPAPIAANVTYFTAQRARRWPTIIMAVVLVAASLTAAYWIGMSKGAAPRKKAEAVQKAHEVGQAANTTTMAAIHYNSKTYELGFDYPANWIVSDTPAKLTVTSPNLALTTPSGKASGHVIVTIQNQQANIPDFPAGGALASLDSDKLTYKQPSSVQRGQTYLSYLGYTGSAGVDSLFLTGDSGYQTGQQVPLADVTKGNPLVSVKFATCSSSFCAKGTPKPVTLLAGSWKNSSFKPQVTNLLQSLTLN